MKKIELTILGSNSAMPAYGRFPTSQVLNIDGQLLLIDCGEACQIRLSQYKIKRNKISHIFISHLHGDHVYGLPGLLGSMNHLGRKEKLQIIGPKGIRELVESVLRLSEVTMQYLLKFHELAFPERQVVFKNNNIQVSAFPVDHRIACFGYLFEEQYSPLNIKKEAISQYALTIEEIKNAKAGVDIVRATEIIPNEIVTHARAKLRSYAYCADSRPNKNILPFIRNVDCLYFESTYLHNMAMDADSRGHSTALQAGQMATSAQVGQLIIGHFSSRYKDVSPLLAEAKTIFSNTHLAYDGAIFQL